MFNIKDKEIKLITNTPTIVTFWKKPKSILSEKSWAKQDERRFKIYHLFALFWFRTKLFYSIIRIFF